MQIYRLDQIERWVNASQRRRVDAGLIEDSHMVAANDSGKKMGFARGLYNRLGMYATGVMPPNCQGGYVNQYTYVGGADPQMTSIPSAMLSNYILDPVNNGWFPISPSAYYTGADIPNSYYVLVINGDVTANADGTTGSPINKANSILRFHFTYETFATGAGEFQPMAVDVGSISNLTPGAPVINTNTNVNGIAYGSLDVPYTVSGPPAGWRTARGVALKWASVNSGGSASIKAPFGALWARAENPDQVTGVAVHMSIYQGGLGTFELATLLRDVNPVALDQYIREMVRLQNDDPMLLWMIGQGHNDSGRSAALSLGPNPAPSNTIAGIIDNHVYAIAQLRACWLRLGYDLKNLFFYLEYHQQAESRPTLSRDLNRAMRILAESTYNVASQDRDNGLITTSYMRNRTDISENGLFDAGAGFDFHYKNVLAANVHGDLVARAIAPPLAVTTTAEDGSTVYIIYYDRAGQVADMTSNCFGDWIDTFKARYCEVIQPTAAGFYKHVKPSWMRGVPVRAEVYNQLGGSVAPSTDTLLRTISFDEWDDGNSNSNGEADDLVTVDSISPSVSSVSVPSDGLSVIVTMIEVDNLPVTPVEPVGFIVRVNGTSRDYEITRTALNTYTLTLFVTVYSNDIVTLDYSANPDGVKDSVGNAMATFTGQAVSNGSLVAAPSNNAKPSRPVISPVAGTYLSTVTVTITADAGAVIYYSISGPIVPLRGIRYSGSFQVARSATVRAVAYHNGRVSLVTTSSFRLSRLG